MDQGKDTAELLAIIVARFADEVADRVARRLEAKIAHGDAYTSAAPPGISRARFVRIAKTISGARREGRIWIVPRSAWEAARTARRGESLPNVADPTSAADDVDDMLSGAGLRATRLRVVKGGAR